MNQLTPGGEERKEELEGCAVSTTEELRVAWGPMIWYLDGPSLVYSQLDVRMT